MIQADFRNREEVYSFVKKLQSYKFDLVVNNAGMLVYEDIENYQMSGWDQVISVNLEAPLIISQGLMNNIKEQGSIINISSTDYQVGAITSVSYAASKAGLVSLTKSLALNLASRKIRVNAIAPNWVITDMGEAGGDEVLEESVRLTPLKRNTSTLDIANLVEFLASDKASFINGQTLILDGGYFAGDYLINLEATTHE
jgi:3-oxoacyl-[acyl-carrier protein] reductase